MNEQQITETMTSLIGGRFYRSYNDVAMVLDIYVAYQRISKETYDHLLKMAREAYPEENMYMGR